MLEPSFSSLRPSSYSPRLVDDGDASSSEAVQPPTVHHDGTGMRLSEESDTGTGVGIAIEDAGTRTRLSEESGTGTGVSRIARDDEREIYEHSEMHQNNRIGTRFSEESETDSRPENNTQNENEIGYNTGERLSEENLNLTESHSVRAEIQANNIEAESDEENGSQDALNIGLDEEGSVLGGGREWGGENSLGAELTQAENKNSDLGADPFPDNDLTATSPLSNRHNLVYNMQSPDSEGQGRLLYGNEVPASLDHRTDEDDDFQQVYTPSDEGNDEDDDDDFRPQAYAEDADSQRLLGMPNNNEDQRSNLQDIDIRGEDDFQPQVYAGGASIAGSPTNQDQREVRDEDLQDSNLLQDTDDGVAGPSKLTSLSVHALPDVTNGTTPLHGLAATTAAVTITPDVHVTRRTHSSETTPTHVAMPPNTVKTMPPDDMETTPPDSLETTPSNSGNAMPADNVAPETIVPHATWLEAPPPDNEEAPPPDNEEAPPPDNEEAPPPDNEEAPPPDNEGGPHSAILSNNEEPDNEATPPKNVNFPPCENVEATPHLQPQMSLSPATEVMNDNQGHSALDPVLPSSKNGENRTPQLTTPLTVGDMREDSTSSSEQQVPNDLSISPPAAGSLVPPIFTPQGPVPDVDASTHHGSVVSGHSGALSGHSGLFAHREGSIISGFSSRLDYDNLSEHGRSTSSQRITIPVQTSDQDGDRVIHTYSMPPPMRSHVLESGHHMIQPGGEGDRDRGVVITSTGAKLDRLSSTESSVATNQIANELMMVRRVEEYQRQFEARKRYDGDMAEVESINNLSAEEEEEEEEEEEVNVSDVEGNENLDGVAIGKLAHSSGGSERDVFSRRSRVSEQDEEVVIEGAGVTVLSSGASEDDDSDGNSSDVSMQRPEVGGGEGGDLDDVGGDDYSDTNVQPLSRKTKKRRKKVKKTPLLSPKDPKDSIRSSVIKDQQDQAATLAGGEGVALNPSNGGVESSLSLIAGRPGTPLSPTAGGQGKSLPLTAGGQKSTFDQLSSIAKHRQSPPKLTEEDREQDSKKSSSAVESILLHRPPSTQSDHMIPLATRVLAPHSDVSSTSSVTSHLGAKDLPLGVEFLNPGGKIMGEGARLGPPLSRANVTLVFPVLRESSVLNYFVKEETSFIASEEQVVIIMML